MTGLVQGVLVLLNKRINWIFYVMQMVLLLVFSWYNHLYGDVVNDIVYIAIGCIGWYTWGKPDSKITRCRITEKVIYVFVILAVSAAAFYILSKTDDSLPMLDSFTTVSSFAATYYMMRRKIDTWVIWFINDIAYSLEYFLLPNQSLLLMSLNIIWTVMAVASYIAWFKEMSSAPQPETTNNE